MTLRGIVSIGLFALSAVVYFPSAEWLATASRGTSLLLHLEIIYGFPMLAAFFSIPLSIPRLFYQRTRLRAAQLLGLAIMFLACFLTASVLGHFVRMSAMKSLVQHSQPLIAAIKSYERDHSSPPPSLPDLVPKYLAEVPSTGMAAYPEYRYYTGTAAEREYAGNPWALSVFTPGGGFNFDMILYLPSQNYPEHGYGGWLRRVEDWAYVHE